MARHRWRPRRVRTTRRTNTVTLTPAATLANSKTYTISVTGGASGVKDLAGNALATTAHGVVHHCRDSGPTTSVWSTQRDAGGARQRR